MDFTPKRTGETEIFSHNFRRSLAPGETILSAVWRVVVIDGSDPNPNDMISGVAIISGSVVSTFLTQGVADTTYIPFCTVVTNLGQTLELPDPGTGKLLVKANDSI